MNPNKIFSSFIDDSLVKQAECSVYETFVALPFAPSFHYDMQKVLTSIIRPAATAASQQRKSSLKAFGEPSPVEQLRGAREITEEIIVQILEKHFFMADLTTLNANVLLEAGVALALKPSSQVIMIFDGDLSNLPFDIKTNEVIRYDKSDSIARIAAAMLNSAEAFEINYQLHVHQITKGLSSDAIFLLNYLGQIQVADRPRGINRDMAKMIFTKAADPHVRYSMAEQELLRARLVHMNHTPGGVPDGDAFSTSPTALGRRVIEDRWPVLKNSAKSNAF